MSLRLQTKIVFGVALGAPAPPTLVLLDIVGDLAAPSRAPAPSKLHYENQRSRKSYDLEAPTIVEPEPSEPLQTSSNLFYV